MKRMAMFHIASVPLDGIGNSTPGTQASCNAQPLSASVVVLRYGQQVRTLARGQRLAPGIVLQDIDSDGLIFNNQGRRERLPWPPRPAVTGFKRQG